MAEKVFPNSQVPIRKSVELLPQIFQTESNDKFMSGTVDPLIQPGVLDKIVGYIGRRYGKTYKGSDVYLDTDNTLRSRYQLEPGIVFRNSATKEISNFYDYLDFKNQIKFFGNQEDNDKLTTSQSNYTWNPPIDWDKFVNYREYYWVPGGPPTVFVQGQAQNIISTYKVKLGINAEWILYPDGLTPNPSITLYRGQTYKFQIDSPTNGFVIRTNYDSGSLLYNPDLPYQAGQMALYDGKLWKAKVSILPSDGSSITLDSQDWEYIAEGSYSTVFDYSSGVTNNGITKGTLTFKVPLDAPDTLFYQGTTNGNSLGKFLIRDIEENTKIDIEKEILGKKYYRSSNGVEFTNGLAVQFTGTVTPDTYANEIFIVEGVGKSINLVSLSGLTISTSLNLNAPEVLFDNAGFDAEPFDDATAYPATKDYITINRSSPDDNPWSRYNRWFHKSVLEYSHSLNNSSFDAQEDYRAKRPIIEFESGLQLFNHGALAKQSVDYIDDFTTDVFSMIEGSLGYNIDGEQLFEGARVLFTADNDSLVANKIYVVTFITHNGRKQISLKESDDTVSVSGECVLIRRGNNNQGLMYHFNGTKWIKSQEKTKLNQSPLFDIFDSEGVSFGDLEKYPVSSFAGTPIVSYKVGSSVVDSELGFSLSYQNIDNVGDIEFDFNFDIESFTYQIQLEILTKNINTGFIKKTVDGTYINCWSLVDDEYMMPVLDSQVVGDNLRELTFNTLNWQLSSNLEIFVYRNGEKYTGSYSAVDSKFTFATDLTSGDVISLKIFGDAVVDQGYYEIPAGLEKNPLNQTLTSFTLGTASDHVATAVEFDSEYQGVFPGNSNLRDIYDYRTKARRFLKHSGLPALAIALLCDKNVNVIKSLQFAKSRYTEFKNNFLKVAESIVLDEPAVDLVDSILSELNRTKNLNSSFAGSDMVGTGAYSTIEYVVEDTGIKTFSLSEFFSLETPSNKAVYVYLNSSQLLVNRDYTFDSTFGFVRLSIDLAEGDVVQIREYNSTAACFIPPTPTKLGLYKKYTPMRYLDDTYRTPRYIIQGHDGSRYAAFNDYRDDILLELELRIYNNIKQQYDETVFDIDETVGNYFYEGLYNKLDLDSITLREFLKWIADTNVDYKSNSYFDSEDSFTYTYSNMTDPTGTKNLPGYWRGVYQWFYDTDRPHTNPWEMLGFSEKPTWWESVYGPAPYTKYNLILWEDIRDGIIRQGSRAGTYDRYKHPSILNHIPVDEHGNLISPLDSNLAGNFVLINNQGPFALGDAGPVESAWRQTSEWPFAVIIAMALMKPFNFISNNLDRTRITTNIIGQNVSSSAGTFFTKEDFFSDQTVQASGLISYITDYLKYQNLTTDRFFEMISEIDISLTSRLSGFVDQQQQRFILDSKNPRSTSGNVFVPPENYDIIFNVGSPIASVSYSGVLIEKTDRGWVISGYDDLDPYFNYYQAVSSQKDPVMTVGGISEKFLDWAPEKFYGNGVIVRYNSVFYRSLQSHESGINFESVKWQKLSSLPVVGGVEAFKRRQFNTLTVKELNYGTLLSSVQEVVDFLLGYEMYLKGTGFVFSGYNPETQSAQDFTTASKEFMFWTKHNWAVGSLLSLSPLASSIEFVHLVGVADNVLDSFYEYNIKKSSGTKLDSKNIDIKRDFQKVTITTSDTTDGIYFAKLYLVLKEHVVIFDDRTVFNDVIYDKTTGYRQERIKSRGFRTTDWDGDYTVPGFIFDNVKINNWEPFTDYRLGDIISYKSFYWVSLNNQEGTESFVTENWSKLDSLPTKRLIPNFDYRINQFEDYYNLDSEGFGSVQKDLGRHFVGYQQREYLANLAEDEITQFKLYQGYIREKGTANSVTKVFDKLSQSETDSVVLNEEWAFRVGQFGGTRQLREIEFKIDRSDLEIDPQPIVIRESLNSNDLDKYLDISVVDFTLVETPFNSNINPVTIENFKNRDAGYINTKQIDHFVKNRDEILELDISTVNNNDHLAVTFDGPSWTVLRFTENQILRIINAVKTDTQVEVTFNVNHSFEVDDIVGIKDLVNLTGFYKVIEKTQNTITVTVNTAAEDPEVDSSLSKVSHFVECRFAAYGDIPAGQVALLEDGSKLFIDNNGSDLWEVVQKNKQYLAKDLVDYGITSPEGTGYKVLYAESLRQIISSIPRSGFVMSYYGTATGIGVNQIISPATELTSFFNNSFGQALAISPDEKYLFVGSPLASGMPTFYKGEFDADDFNKEYKQGDIILSNGRLWRALDNFRADSSTGIDVYSQDWELVNLIEATPAGSTYGPSNAGTVSIYEWADQQWNLKTTIMSPRPDTNEKFGHAITVSKSGSTYTFAVSAPGAEDSKGRVYLFTGNGSTWQHLENTQYVGIYDPTKSYPLGSIVWSDGSLWEALADNPGDGSSFLDTNSNDWKKLDPITTSCSLPKNTFIDDDGSTLASGLLDINEVVALTKSGDGFGHDIKMNSDGSILVISAPYSDGQYFANFKGDWIPTREYKEGDVVRYQGQYHRLEESGDATIAPDSTYDSTITSLGQYPDLGDPWFNIGDSEGTPSGKLFVYQRDAYGRYNLAETISAANLADISDIDESINSGDQFGYSIDIDLSGYTIVASSPEADINGVNQGSVYVFKTDSITDINYRLTQKLESFENQPNESFGSAVSLSPRSERIVVGAKNAPHTVITRFDTSSGTTFDEGKTFFQAPAGYTGQVYVFERKDAGYFLVEKLQADLTAFESFGGSVDCASSLIIVGSPTYKVDNAEVGFIRLFEKDSNKDSLEVLQRQEAQVDLSLIESVQLYDEVNNIKIADIDYIDSRKLKVLGIVEQELSFKTPYDPAIYNLGTEDVVVDESQTWYEKNVGKIWWNLSAVKWLNYEQDDIAYRSGNWNSQAYGSSIDIYEWVETPLLPSEWSALADTTDGLSQGISGQPLYPNDDVYSYKQIYNTTTGLISSTLYYYWVKNKNTVPENTDRKLSGAVISSYISNPAQSGLPILAFLGPNMLLAYNFAGNIDSDYALLNIEYRKDRSPENLVHNEYQLLTEGVADSLPTPSLENKWVDSLIGVDRAGNEVPDPSLPAKKKYGIGYRPRQSMFIDREQALRITVDKINSVLNTRAFADNLNSQYLFDKDTVPDSSLNLFDLSVDTYVDLQQVGTTRLRQAVLSPNIIDGRIDSIEIVDSGFGYRTVPPIDIQGDGIGAAAYATLDSQGRISSVTVTSKGRRYSSAILRVRAFGVLVNYDETSENYWTIYSYDQQRNNFYRSRSQGYDTTRYWSYKDWWSTGYSESSRIVKEIQEFYLESTISTEVGDLVKIKEYGNGGWAVIQRTVDGEGTLLGKYNLVGRQNGTIYIKDTIYNNKTSPLGYDEVAAYDTGFYDLQPSTEIRNILLAVKNDLFVDDLRVEWNNLFFVGIRQAFSEQLYIDWAFKTSFLNAVHNVGALEQKTNYKSDNLDSYKDYLDEVKPYRTTIREYTSRYTGLENNGAATTDFDLPPVYSTIDGKILPVNENYNRFNEYPWKWWADNNGYEIVDIRIADGGEGYTNPPKVLIEGNGSGATAEAYIYNGSVSDIRVITTGSGYTEIPTITLVGGNGFNNQIARAVPILGNGKARSMTISLKFDRISKTGTYTSLTQTETFVAQGNNSVFDLAYCPTIDKTKISITKNNLPVLFTEYSISLYVSSTDTYSLIKGKLILNQVPQAGEVIRIVYDKNDQLLDSINRIEKYYSPTAGMKGKQLNQLMTGIDFGGVQVQATTFDVTGGWDALPWFTDGWDGVEPNKDFGIVADGSTNTVTLPYTPEDGEIITIYIKRSDSDETIRVDDPYYLSYDGSTVQPNGRTVPAENALIETFVGDGSTNIINIGEFIRTNPGDTLIFRPVDSDGSVVISDVNILDTRISGGTLAALGGAYSTANGLSAEDITIDGGKFISPDHVPATEENVPGQVLDSLSIKVYTSPVSGAAPLQTKIRSGDGATTVFDIGLKVLESKSVVVYVDKVKQNYTGATVDYSIDFENNTIEFTNPPADKTLVEIISIGVGGVEILDYQEFIADGTTNLFLCGANYTDTQSIFVTVDGEEQDVGYANSADFIETKNRVIVNFGVTPAAGSTIKIVCLGAALDADSSGQSVIRINQQSFVYDGSTRSFDLDKFVNLSRGSSLSSMLVNLNGRQLVGVDTTVKVYDGTDNTVLVGVDPTEAIGTITSGNIKVFVNGELLRFVIDYTFDGNQNLITIDNDVITSGDIIKVETDVRSQYQVDGNNITFPIDSITLVEGDVIEVTWFSEYPTLDLISDQATGGQAKYRLQREPLSVSYVWVYKNGQRLTQDQDYYVDVGRKTVYLAAESTTSDEIKIIQFARDIFRQPSAFEIQKDMLNFYRYKRYSASKQVVLDQDLYYYSQEIVLTDASSLTAPIPSRNIPGTIVINGEKIDYFVKDGNTLRQLRRGSTGTPIAEIHQAGSFVVNNSFDQSVPYNETQEEYEAVSDGSTLLIGPLEYVPVKSSRTSWSTTSIPEGYGACDMLEVFVGGRRLRKDPLSVYDEQLGASSPSADKTLEAEFSVDGTTAYIRLTEAIPVGTKIRVVKRTGKVWYDKGETTVTSGKSLIDNVSPIARFISEKYTELPE